MEEQAPVKKKSTRTFILFSSFVLIFIIAFGLYTYFAQEPGIVSDFVHQDVLKVAQLLEKIDTHCKILAIRSGNNPIDFLNVIAFAGSEIGPLNLEYPKKWQGPYIQDNPVFLGHVYELVSTNNGYFVVPGRGARLPNGLIMGTDIKITQTSDIAAMTQPGGALYYDGYAFAHQINLGFAQQKTSLLSIKTLDHQADTLLDKVVLEVHETSVAESCDIVA